jgi:hypothetical protein
MVPKINWFGLAGGVLALVVAAASLVFPWWQIIVGDALAKVVLSPTSFGSNVLGATMIVPIMVAVNVVSTLLLVASGIALTVYSVIPTKRYSKNLLGFAYKKPLVMFVSFVVLLFLLTNLGAIVSAISNTAAFGSPRLSGMNLDLPWSGTTTIIPPNSMTPNATVSIPVSTSFQWTFWLALATAGLCVAARIYHTKLAGAENATRENVSETAV